MTEAERAELRQRIDAARRTRLEQQDHDWTRGTFASKYGEHGTNRIRTTYHERYNR